VSEQFSSQSANSI